MPHVILLHTLEREDIHASMGKNTIGRDKDNWVATVHNLIYHNYPPPLPLNIYACHPFYALHDCNNRSITIGIIASKTDFDTTVKAYVEKGYEYHEVTNPPTLYCEWCGKELTGKQKRYCSKQCERDAARLRNKFAEREGNPNLKSINYRVSKSQASWIEMADETNYWLGKSGEIRRCKYCGRPIPHDARPDKIFCNKDCRHAYRTKLRRESKK